MDLANNHEVYRVHKKKILLIVLNTPNLSGLNISGNIRTKNWINNFRLTFKVTNMLDARDGIRTRD